MLGKAGTDRAVQPTFRYNRGTVGNVAADCGPDDQPAWAGGELGSTGFVPDRPGPNHMAEGRIMQWLIDEVFAPARWIGETLATANPDTIGHTFWSECCKSSSPGCPSPLHRLENGLKRAGSELGDLPPDVADEVRALARIVDGGRRGPISLFDAGTYYAKSGIADVGRRGWEAILRCIRSPLFPWAEMPDPANGSPNLTPPAPKLGQIEVEGGTTVGRSSRPAVRPRQIAEEVRSLPSALEPFMPADVSRVGGALLGEAIGLGAFAGSEHTRLRLLVQNARLRFPNDWQDTAFSEAINCLAPDLMEKIGPVGAIAPACQVIADAIEREADRIDAQHSRGDNAGSTPLGVVETERCGLARHEVTIQLMDEVRGPGQGVPEQTEPRVTLEKMTPEHRAKLSMVQQEPRLESTQEQQARGEAFAPAQPAAKTEQGEEIGRPGRRRGENGSNMDRRFMERAVEAARKSAAEDGRVHPKVGVVIVKNGEELAVAYRGELEKGEHAEFTALERKLANEMLAGATVYTTLEPCTTRNHPKLPCAVRLIERKVARVVIGMLDPNPKISGKGVLKLREANIAVDLFPPDLMANIEEMNREFIRQHKNAAEPSPPAAGSDLETAIVTPSEIGRWPFVPHILPRVGDLPGMLDELRSAVFQPMGGGTCAWQVKESQVLKGVERPETIGYYPVLVGLETLVRCFPSESLTHREDLINWSLSARNFDANTNWFIHPASASDPADPPIYDIRHTAEAGTALLIDGRPMVRARHIINNIVRKQGFGCAEGSWRSNDAVSKEDPLSTVICAELVARGMSVPDYRDTDGLDLSSSLQAALKYLEAKPRPRGWRYEGLDEAFWEPWGASIVGFRLRRWLTSRLREHVINCLVKEIESSDLLMVGYNSPAARTRMLARYLCALSAVDWNDPRLGEWQALLVQLWHRLEREYHDISTKLHLAYLFVKPDDYHSDSS